MRQIPCEVCGSDDHQLLFEGRDRIFGLPGVFNVVRCRGCGLLFINPQPDAGELKAYYPGDYYESQSSRFREYSSLKRGVLETYYGYEKDGAPSFLAELARRAFFLPLRAWYGYAIPFRGGGRLLDIGCGNGTELYRLAAMGWEGYGVEMDPGASQRAREGGLSVLTGDLLDAKYGDSFFQVVRMSYVLEHLANPRETLREIRRILVPGGRLYLSVQSAKSLHYRLFGRNWFSLDVPRHLFSFDPGTLKRLLSSMDLETTSIRCESGPRTFLGSLQYWVNERYRGGASLEESRSIFESHVLKRLFHPFCWCVDRLGLGDLIHVEAVKK
jgi:SAM-dependent methyltransferase